MSDQNRQYSQHREQQRERILDAAEALCIEQGIDSVSMSAIARAAGITRKTLYAYFASKQEIAWEVLRHIFEHHHPAADTLQGSTVQQIEQFMTGMLELAEASPAHGRFIVEFNSLYAREANADHMRQITGREPGATPYLTGLIQQGIADGSLLPALDSALVSAAIWNLLSAINSRFALLGHLIPQEYGQSVEDIYREICRGYLRGIQNHQPPQENEDEEATL